MSYSAVKRQELRRALTKHQAAISAGLEQRRKTYASGEVVTLRSGVQLIIRYGTNGYEVAGLAAIEKR